jgi:L-alanine-DL-glutamate epimerase-like enolase superfamily enzyme
MELMIGGMLETEVTMTASLHFACGTGLVRYFDLDTPFFLTQRVTAASPWHRNDARLTLPTGPGLGLELAPW